MQDIDLLKQKPRLRTFDFILLSIITLGLYDLIWIYNNNKFISKLTGITVTNTHFLIILLSTTAWGSLLDSAPEENFHFHLIGGVLTITSYIMTIIWSNNARVALTYHCLGQYNFKLKTTSFYILIFNVFYINYVLNSLRKLDEKHDNQSILTEHK